VTVLYAMQRYCLMFSMVVRQFEPIGMVGCHVYPVFLYLSDLLSLLGVVLFSSFRVWAICGRINVMVVMVFLCSMFVPCINIYNLSRPMTYGIVEGGICVATIISDGIPNVQ